MKFGPLKKGTRPDMNKFNYSHELDTIVIFTGRTKSTEIYKLSRFEVVRLPDIQF